MIVGLNHLGICAHDGDAALKLLVKSMGAKIKTEKRTEYPDRGQISTYAELCDGTEYEIMEPFGEGPGVVRSFLEKNGEGFHHISLLTDDLDADCAAFEAAGCKIIGKMEGTLAFVHPKGTGGILYELVDKTAAGK